MKDKRNATLKNSALRFWKLLSAVLYTWLFAQCWMHFYVSQMVSPYQWKGNLAVALLYCLISVLFIRVYRGYAVSIISGSEVVYSQSLGLFLCNCVAYILLVLLCERLVTPLPLLGLQAVQMVMVFLWTKVACWIDAALSRPQETVIVYRDREDVAKVYTMYRFAQKYHVVETVENPKNYYDATARLGGIKTVFIVGVDATVRNGILKYCLDEGIDAYVIPKVGDIILRGAKMHISGDEAFLRVCRSAQTVEHAIIKRVTDIVVSLLGLVILSPVMAVTAIAIKCNDGGPVLYRQKRLTRNGKVFEILKFRTMRVDAEKDGVARLAAEGDDRITSVGRVVRRYRIDELMQLVNVLWGEMSLVGPRPERPEIAARYEKTMPAFSLRLQVKAGVTGYAQIYGKYNTEPYEKLQMDLVYINNVMKLVFTQFFGRNTPHYTIYLFAGNIIFTYFREATEQGMTALLSNAKIFTKVNVPKYLFLFSKNVQTLINFGLTLAIFFVFCAFDGITFTWKFFLLLYPIVCLVLFNLGVGLVLSALYVFFRDMQYLWTIFTRLLMYVSAIFYTINSFPKLAQQAFHLNPV